MILVKILKRSTWESHHTPGLAATALWSTSNAESGWLVIIHCVLIIFIHESHSTKRGQALEVQDEFSALKVLMEWIIEDHLGERNARETLALPLDCRQQTCWSVESICWVHRWTSQTVLNTSRKLSCEYPFEQCSSVFPLNWNLLPALYFLAAFLSHAYLYIYSVMPKPVFFPFYCVLPPSNALWCRTDTWGEKLAQRTALEYDFFWLNPQLQFQHLIVPEYYREWFLSIEIGVIWAVPGS